MSADKNNIYYDISRLMSYNKTLSLVTSGRSSGKTYAIKQLLVSSAIKSMKKAIDPDTGEVDEAKIKAFIIIRRFNKEINANNLKAFYMDIEPYFKEREVGIEFKVVGKEFFIKLKQCKKFTKVGEALCLSAEVTYKSRVFNNVYYTLFDEAGLDSPYHKMLKNEPKVYLSLLSTISRNRGGVRHIVAMNNNCLEKLELLPYLGLRLNFANLQAGFYKSKTNSEVIMEVYNNTEEFIKQASEQSGFIRMIQQTEYGKTNLQNVSTSVSDVYIMDKKPRDSRHLCQFLIDNTKLSLWLSDKEGLVYWSSLHHDDSNPRKYNVTDSFDVVDYQLIRKFKGTGLCRMLRQFRNENLSLIHI